MKKRLFGFMLAAIMAFGALTGAGPARQTEVKAATAVTEIPVTEVDDINYEAVSAQSAGDYIAQGTQGYEKQYKFTLKRPAYVTIATYSGLVSSLNLSRLQYKITYNEAGTNVVQGTEGTHGIGNGDSEKEYLVLDAGTYYVTVWLKDTAGMAKNAYGSYEISVLAKYSGAITRNATKTKAAAVGTDKQNAGILTATTRNNWYKFKVSGRTTVNITTWLESEWSTNKGAVRNAPMAVTLWNCRNKVVAFWNNMNYGEACTKKNVTLSSGTYYLSFYGDRYYRYGQGGYNDSISQSAMDTSHGSEGYIYNGGEVNFKITTIKAPAGVKAVNQLGRKVKVTFKKFADVKGYEIWYSTNKNFKSSVKKKSVKGAAVTLKNLKKGKTYYVRIRSWKYDMDYNKLYSTWMTKSVKIKK